ncbi:MAG: FHA domain-containing protein, partial [Chloroflexi bacterium]|nr:FHA domain-containing protein [Chloroflexota bacterium]
MTTGRATGGPDPAVLARSVLFSGLPAEIVNRAATRFLMRRVADGDVICAQGLPGDEMYVVESGRFAVDAALAGPPVRLAELGPGAVFGEIAVVTHRPRSATVTAMAPGIIWSLHRSNYQDLARQFPRLGVVAGNLAAARTLDNERRLAHEPQQALVLKPTQDIVTIGRDDGNDLVLRDPRVSRRHALVRRLGQTFRVEDLGSTNGIFVNGRRVDRADLRPGDLIQVGAQSLRFDPAVLTQYARGRGAQVDAVGLSRLVG